RSAQHREVVAEDRDGLAVDCAQTADDTIAVGTVVLHPELVVVVAGEFVDLLEGIGIEESGDALTGGLLAALVLIVHRALVAGGGSVPTLGRSEERRVGKKGRRRRRRESGSDRRTIDDERM